MDRAAKIEKRKARAARRAEKHNDKYHKKIQTVRSLGLSYSVVSLSDVTVSRGGYVSMDFWEDSNSPTGYSQKCSYAGTCQYPCNGDC
jgi:hypothetical protein